MKSVLITGANSGFGYLIALKFARNGYKVYATTRSLEKEGVKELNSIAQNERLDITWLVLDVTDDISINGALEGINSLDVLVNNAGFGTIGPVMNFTSDDFLRQLNTNVVGVHRMVRGLISLLIKSKGKIINISSIAGRVSFANYALYSSSKHALRAYCQALRQELRSKGVDVAIVEPGTFKTNFEQNINKGEENESIDRLNKRINKYKKILVNFGLMPKLNKPEKVASLVYRLASTKNMKFSNLIGIDARLISLYRKWIPEFLWDKIMDLIGR